MKAEIHRIPFRRHKRFDDLRAVRFTVRMKGFDAVNARRCIEMIVVAPVPAVCLQLWCRFKVKLKSVQRTDRVETFPGFTENESDSLVVRDRARDIVDKELWGE